MRGKLARRCHCPIPKFKVLVTKARVATHLDPGEREFDSPTCLSPSDVIAMSCEGLNNPGTGRIHHTYLILYIRRWAECWNDRKTKTAEDECLVKA